MQRARGERHGEEGNVDPELEAQEVERLFFLSRLARDGQNDSWTLGQSEQSATPQEAEYGVADWVILIMDAP